MRTALMALMTFGCVVALTACAAQPDSVELGKWKAAAESSLSDQEDVLGIMSGNVEAGASDGASVALGLPAGANARSINFSCFGSGRISGVFTLASGQDTVEHQFEGLECGKTSQIVNIPVRQLQRAKLVKFAVRDSSQRSAWQIAVRS